MIGLPVAFFLQFPKSRQFNFCAATKVRAHGVSVVTVRQSHRDLQLDRLVINLLYCRGDFNVSVIRRLVINFLEHCRDVHINVVCRR